MLYVVGEQAGRALVDVVQVPGTEGPELDRALALGYSQPGLVRLARARAFLLRHDRDSALRELKLALASDPTLDSRARSLIAP